MSRVAIFTRVSKKSQATDRQVSELTEYAGQHRYQVVATFTEQISGSTKNDKRPVLQELLTLAMGGQLDKVLVSEVSRLGRSTVEVLKVLEQLEQLRVSVFVLNYHIETLPATGKPNPLALFMLTLLADLARMEKETLRERIHSGLDEARRQGKTLGRRKGTGKSDEQLLKDHADIVRQLRSGQSIRNTAAITAKGEATVKKVKKLLEADLPKS
ncbi:recombinase family protein [Hymenobacter sp. BT175]|uniref:recombinase family protein n=1 Tax=Hymenobacter translucens TaxID=2886507 RepID=UPI001D0E3EE5|nr:recombinase family protein [Hymenobacter translucens]MCC2546436.1 recombinase family protein [Hymenobacter translucens]